MGGVRSLVFERNLSCGESRGPIALSTWWADLSLIAVSQ